MLKENVRNFSCDNIKILAIFYAGELIFPICKLTKYSDHQNSPHVSDGSGRGLKKGRVSAFESGNDDQNGFPKNRWIIRPVLNLFAKYLFQLLYNFFHLLPA